MNTHNCRRQQQPMQEPKQHLNGAFCKNNYSAVSSAATFYTKIFAKIYLSYHCDFSLKVVLDFNIHNFTRFREND